MSQKKMTAKRRSWASIQRAKAASEDHHSGCREAKEAFELAERVRQARERVGLTQAELAARMGSTRFRSHCVSSGVSCLIQPLHCFHAGGGASFRTSDAHGCLSRQRLR